MRYLRILCDIINTRDYAVGKNIREIHGKEWGNEKKINCQYYYSR